MGPESIPLRKQIETNAGQAPKTQPDENIDPRHKALSVALEFTKRLFEVKSLEDLYFVMTNDIRVLIDFDRAFLVVHMSGKSEIVSIGNQPLLETNTNFYEVANKLAVEIRDLQRGLFLSDKPGAEISSDVNVSQQARQGLQNYIEISKCSYALCVPLLNREVPIGHLVLEYFNSKPNQVEIITLLNIATFISAALAHNWVISKKPAILELIDPKSRDETKKRRRKGLLTVMIVLVAFVSIFFLIPLPFNVGGEAEVEPTVKRVAFCGIDGIVDRVNIAEGSHVKQGQIIATMDTKELDFKIKSARAQYDILTSEAELLKAAAYEDPSKLAESHLVDLKRKSAWEEFTFYNWEQQFLQIKAPASGVVLTKQIETLAGKKFKAGEPFCDIAIPNDLSVDLFLPQDRVSLISIGQTMTVHFDSEPRTPYELTVKQISPLSETVPRLGSVYRVRAPFPNAPASTLVGMKGIASIHVADSSLWSIISTRISNLWRRYYLRMC